MSARMKYVKLDRGEMWTMRSKEEAPDLARKSA